MQNKLIKLILLLSLVACQSQPTLVVNNGLTENRRLENAEPPVWSSSMQKMKHHLTNLEPLIFNPPEFKNREQQKFIAKEIHDLAAASKNVKHDPAIRSKDPTVRFVAEQFSEEIQDAEENFSKGMTEYTRWQLMKATKYCLECHTRMNDGPAFRTSESNPPYVKTLPIVDQLELMIAFRQFQPAFDLALETLNQVKASGDYYFNVDRVARLGLLVAVQLLQDRNQALRFVEAIEKNPVLPSYLADSNRSWKKSLEKWDPNRRLESLSAMRELSKSNISEIESMRLIPALLSHLNQLLSDEDMAETLYLIGENYENLSKISMLSLPEKYYELTIVKFPKTKWAKKSFERFEDLTILGYSGSSGTHIPRKVKIRLDELKKMIQ